MTKNELKEAKGKPYRARRQLTLFAGKASKSRTSPSTVLRTGNGFHCRVNNQRIDTAICIIRQTREPGKCFGCGQFSERIKAMPTIGEIESLTKTFADARQQLADRVRGLEDEIEAIKRKKMTGIRNAVNNVLEKQSALKAALEDSRPLFIRPKTRLFHGVKVGFQKAKGKISWNDEKLVIKLIKKHLPEQAEVLIQTKEKPIKKALANLPAADLKKIGVTVGETGDQVVIESTDSEIDKFVNALLNEKSPDKEEEAA